MSRTICFIDNDGQMGICTHHYTGEHLEGDCDTCDFPEKMKNIMETFSYVHWTDLRKVT